MAGIPTEAPRPLTPDGRLLFATRSARLFAYGLVSVVLVLYLAEVGLSEQQIGLLLTLTLLTGLAVPRLLLAGLLSLALLLTLTGLLPVTALLSLRCPGELFDFAAHALRLVSN